LLGASNVPLRVGSQNGIAQRFDVFMGLAPSSSAPNIAPSDASKAQIARKNRLLRSLATAEMQNLDHLSSL
jgi:hypothetical protein